MTNETCFDWVTLVRSPIDLYSNDIGSPFEEIKAAMITEADQLRIIHSQISAPEVTCDLDAAIAAILSMRSRVWP